MSGRPQYFCHSCRKELLLEKKPGRQDECPSCTAELHSCKNCEFYDPRLTRGCRETQAEEVRDLERANFCNWFNMKKGPLGEDKAASEAKAKSQFEAMFGGGKKAADVDQEKEAAKNAFDSLFRK